MMGNGVSTDLGEARLIFSNMKVTYKQLKILESNEANMMKTLEYPLLALTLTDKYCKSIILPTLVGGYQK